MTTFNSKEENIFYYLTFVVFRRVPIFKSENICQFFIDALNETKEKHPFKLIGYVIMPDHVHLIVNPVSCDIEVVGKEIKGLSANRIIGWLKENEYFTSLEKLKLTNVKKRNHSFCVWQKKVKSVDLWSHKFILQKLNYVHLNPIRAGVCDHPAKWKWSSYNAYLPKTKIEIPIMPDKKGYWTENDFEAATK
jgi:putative transposase